MESIAAAVLVQGNRVLLGHRCPSRLNFPNVWDFIGGHVEQGESPRTAMKRELVEELGVEATLGSAWRLVMVEELRIEMMMWVVHEWSGEVTNAAPEEHDELRWFQHYEIRRLTFPDPFYVSLLDAIFDELRAPPEKHAG